MTKKPWYLRRRIMLAFGLTTALLTLTMSALGARTVWRTVREEIDNLVREELEETRAWYSRDTSAHQDLEIIADVLKRHHPQNAIAWRIWRAQDGEVLGEFGDVALLRENEPPSEILPHLRYYPGWNRWISGDLTPEISVGIMVDGSHQARRFQHFLLAGGSFVLASTLLGTFAGFLLSRRVSRLLEQVARNAREHDGSASLDAGDAPQEIRAVVDALSESLQRIRSESDHARLITSGLAHELRSPLQNLMGETQVVLLREREASEYRHVLESHLEELGQLGRVVDNLVTLCAAGELRRRHGTERFDLGEEARLRLSREVQLAARRGVRIEIEVRGSLEYEGDREALLLALRNVVTNAIEWSPTEGTVAIELQGDDQRITITVDDAGPGVPLQERALIFEPFHRGSAARGRRVGFGLGLALTRSAVAAHGGTIDVGDSPLGGARFRILLPRVHAPGRERDSAHNGSFLSLTPRR